MLTIAIILRADGATRGCWVVIPERSETLATASLVGLHAFVSRPIIGPTGYKNYSCTQKIAFIWPNAVAQLRGAGGCSSTPSLKMGCPAIRPDPMTFYRGGGGSRLPIILH